MDKIKFAENLSRLRKEKKITQEELAKFVGVTKATVSKWETGQSFPDILILPKLATFFDVSIDGLIGYEALMGKEEIRQTYQELVEDFAKKPFEDVMEKSEKLARQYYACYPFLLQVCILWLNHFMLTEDGERQKEILKKTVGLCIRIEKNCKDIGICKDALFIRSIINLQMGKPMEVIGDLEDVLNPLHFQSSGILIQAYENAGRKEEAENFVQISMYMSLLELIACGEKYMELCVGEEALGREAAKRMDGLLRLFELEELHPNCAAGYYYQSALYFSRLSEHDEAMARLEKFVDLAVRMSQKGAELKGDAFFNRMYVWIERLDLGAQSVRHKNLISENVRASLNHPAFESLKLRPDFQKLQKKIDKEAESYE